MILLVLTWCEVFLGNKREAGEEAMAVVLMQTYLSSQADIWCTVCWNLVYIYTGGTGKGTVLILSLCFILHFLKKKWCWCWVLVVNLPALDSNCGSSTTTTSRVKAMVV